MVVTNQALDEDTKVRGPGVEARKSPVILSCVGTMVIVVSQLIIVTLTHACTSHFSFIICETRMACPYVCPPVYSKGPE